MIGCQASKWAGLVVLSRNALFQLIDTQLWKGGPSDAVPSTMPMYGTGQGGHRNRTVADSVKPSKNSSRYALFCGNCYLIIIAS